MAMHTPPLLQDLAVILATAGMVTFLFRKMRQPVVLGYVVAGIIIGPYTPPYAFVKDLPNIEIWSELGVIFLMFALGLEFTFHKLKRVGAAAGGTALIEVISMGGLGFLCGQILGWKFIDSLFLGGMLSISSTTIILKAFDELQVRTKKFSEVVFGVLIVEDLFAILILVILSTIGSGKQLEVGTLFFAALKLVLIVGSWFVVGYFLIPTFLRLAGRHMDDEALIVLSIGLCLCLVGVATYFHYSTALGAFIMGSILAETDQSERIEALLQPIKSIFAAIFFVSVGMLVNPKLVVQYWPSILVISLVTIVGKILSTSFGALLFGQSPQRSVRIGFSLAQIGEFSFIIATLGLSLNITSDFLYPIAVTVSVITTFTTPYLIKISEPCGLWVEKTLPANFKEFLIRYSEKINTKTTKHLNSRFFSRFFQTFTKILFPIGLLKDKILESLAPWDLHLVRIIVHANSQFIGRSLSEIDVRNRYGLNIVLIQRGHEIISPPGAKDHLFPQDHLLVLGTDEQIEVFSKHAAFAAASEASLRSLASYKLERHVVEEDSPFKGQTIRNSGIREKLNTLVVGLEKKNKRFLNPNPLLPLEVGDVLWIVGRF